MLAYPPEQALPTFAPKGIPCTDISDKQTSDNCPKSSKGGKSVSAKVSQAFVDQLIKLADCKGITAEMDGKVCNVKVVCSKQCDSSSDDDDRRVTPCIKLCDCNLPVPPGLCPPEKPKKKKKKRRSKFDDCQEDKIQLLEIPVMIMPPQGSPGMGMPGMPGMGMPGMGMPGMGMPGMGMQGFGQCPPGMYDRAPCAPPLHHYQSIPPPSAPRPAPCKKVALSQTMSICSRAQQCEVSSFEEDRRIEREKALEAAILQCEKEKQEAAEGGVKRRSKVSKNKGKGGKGKKGKGKKK